MEITLTGQELMVKLPAMEQGHQAITRMARIQVRFLFTLLIFFLFWASYLFKLSEKVGFDSNTLDDQSKSSQLIHLLDVV